MKKIVTEEYILIQFHELQNVFFSIVIITIHRSFRVIQPFICGVFSLINKSHARVLYFMEIS